MNSIFIKFFLIALILSFAYAAEKGPVNEAKKDEKAEITAQSKTIEGAVKPEANPNLIFQSKNKEKSDVAPPFIVKSGDGKDERQKRWGYGYGGWGGYGGYGVWGGYGGGWGCCGGFGGGWGGGYGYGGWGWGRR
uniref:Uncharacterized protein n=1 Tax=Meloidogyne enterolobii TaxID=390850 RepID=A0A6V7X4P9_MELEN|nr:unnamed protein product [Meloidogyne enterolobii]